MFVFMMYSFCVCIQFVILYRYCVSVCAFVYIHQMICIEVENTRKENGNNNINSVMTAYPHTIKCT